MAGDRTTASSTILNAYLQVIFAYSLHTVTVVLSNLFHDLLLPSQSHLQHCV